MNNHKTPAYLVVQNDHVNAPVQTLLIQDDLLTARKAAMTLAEALFGAQLDYNEQDAVDVYLVEATNQHDPTPIRIARILSKRTTPENPATDPKRYTQSLDELAKEYRYYASNQLPDGFGSFTLTLRLDPTSTNAVNVTVLFDAMGYAMAIVASINGERGHHFELIYNEADEPVSAHLLD
jgi:hypothetical protein